MFRSLLLVLLLISQPLLISQRAVTLTVNPRVTQQLTNVKIRVEPNPANRHLWLIWYKFEGFESKKYWQLGGEAAKKFYDAQLKLEESGEWQVIARVERNDDSVSMDRTTVLVPGME